VFALITGTTTDDLLACEASLATLSVASWVSLPYDSLELRKVRIFQCIPVMQLKESSSRENIQPFQSHEKHRPVHFRTNALTLLGIDDGKDILVCNKSSSPVLGNMAKPEVTTYKLAG